MFDIAILVTIMIALFTWLIGEIRSLRQQFQKFKEHIEHKIDKIEEKLVIMKYKVDQVYMLNGGKEENNKNDMKKK